MFLEDRVGWLIHLNRKVRVIRVWNLWQLSLMSFFWIQELLWQLTVPKYDTFYELLVKLGLRLEWLESFEKLYIFFELMKRVAIVFGRSFFIITDMIAVVLLCHQCLLSLREVATEEISEANWIFDDSSNVKLLPFVICELLHWSVALVFAETAWKNVQDLACKINFQRFQPRDRLL